MKLLITAATNDEIALFTAENKDADVLITGVGVPSTLYHLQKRFQQIDYDLVILAGFAGSFTDELLLGGTVLVNKDAFGDVGMEEKQIFQPVFDTALADKNGFPFKNGWLINDNELLEKLPYKKVNAITVNTVSDSTLLKQQRQNVFHPQIETMEGAVLHYICLQEKIPFLQIRTISNFVGERDKAKWKLKESVENLSQELTTLIEQLNNKTI